MERVGIWQRVRHTDTALSPLEARHPHVQQVPPTLLTPGRFTTAPLQLTKTLYTNTSKDVQTLANSFARTTKTQRESLTFSLPTAVASCAAMCLSFGVT